MKLRERSEIDNKYKWDLTIMYKDNNEWERDFDEVSQRVKAFYRFKSTVSMGAGYLLSVLLEKDDISRVCEKLGSYAMRKNDEDTRIGENSKLKSKIISLIAEFNEASSFLEPEILQLDPNKIKKYITEIKELKIYEQYLDNIFRFKEHTLSIGEERMLASAGEILASPSRIYTIINNADIKFGKIVDEIGNDIELSKGNFSIYIASQDREVRKKTFFTFYKSYKDLKNTFSEILIGDIKANYFVSKNKKYRDPLEMALFQNNIDRRVYDIAIETVRKNLDKMHRYVRLKKDVLGLEEMHMYDFYVDLIEEYDIEYKYEDAVELVFKALKPLGDDYLTKARKVFDEQWIDVFENKGKRSGAYSSFGYDSPPYILLNYNRKLESVSTLVHELGHSMHSYYSALNQPYVYHGYSIFVAEIASNVNEMLLNMYMIDNSTNIKENLSLINSFLERVKGSIYRQMMFAEFEKKIYEHELNHEPLTEEKLSQIYYELNKEYYGPDIVYDDDIRYEWMRIPHFYYRFYVYQYATGLTAAFFIARDLYEGRENMREKYLTFLAGGSSMYPLELLKSLGIDLTNGDSMNYILEYFDKQIDEFEKIIKEK